ncbi:MAG: glycosyltransferase family 4 protein [Planctomycetes bacterium]|nr:glycosyltransferase family 4 protein [Planctomycetota bacterium]
MRLMLIGHYFPPEVHGGTQSYLEALARRLAGQGHELLVIAGSARFVAGGAVSREERDGFRILRIHRDQAVEFLSGDLGSPRILELVRAETRAFAPELVHLHHWHALSRGLVAALADLGLPVLVTLHDLFVSCPRHFRMPDARRFCAPDVDLEDCARCVGADLAPLPLEAVAAGLGERLRVFRTDLGRAARVITVSGAQRDFLRSLPGLGDQEMTVMPIGCPALAAPPAPTPIPGELRLVNWAGLDPRKGPQILLAALRMTAAPERYHLVFHGRPGHADFMAELEELGRGLDLRFAGAFADEDRAGFAAASDLAVMPYLAFETYALTVDEAMHLGLPVVVSDRGAPPERVGGRGAVVPADDPAALAALLDRLRLEPERLAAMRAAPGGARLLDRHFDELEALYRDTATRSRG